MPPSTTSFFPDINVWVALTYEGHVHHATAAAWFADPRVTLVDEPAGIETRFRALTRRRQPATKDWADSFLAAFATVGQLTLVTVDRGLQVRAKSAILLG